MKAIDSVIFSLCYGKMKVGCACLLCEDVTIRWLIIGDSVIAALLKSRSLGGFTIAVRSVCPEQFQFSLQQLQMFISCYTFNWCCIWYRKSLKGDYFQTLYM